MTTSSTPRVSVLIPVYNGERMLAEAIRSVQAQTYPNWDLVICNNRSTDGTLALAESFAAGDPRVRVYTYPTHVNVIDSHSNAFAQTAPEAKYAKLLGADDWLFPTCLEEMVKVAEAHPSVGMVLSYILAGSRVLGPALPYPSPVVSGREVCRLRLLKGQKGWGGPSASMIRADIVRQKQPFYNPLNYAGDIEAYLDLLKDHDMGFVHQVLTYMRQGEASRTTSYLVRVDSYPAGDVDEVTKFGRFYLNEHEYQTRLREVTREYYRFLGKSVIDLRNREFWDYHLRHFKAMGYPPNYPRIGLHALLYLFDLVGNPKRTIEGIWRRVRAKLNPPSAPHPPAKATATKPATE
jgi:glycosyltransferase involved in cell wall biosynthesis